ncbi:MAG: rhodanese-like domain-containing protein [Clostridia bacterium]|nr:rhodanese-like domain-containing protein [Clostridia bacterium]
MKKVSLILAIVLCLSMLAGCSDTGEYNFKTITAAEAKELIDTGDYIVLDVRTQEEYDEKHIPGSVHIPIDKNDVEPFKQEVVKQLTNKRAKIIVYCMSGFRSDIAVKAMSSLGYKKLYNMIDGIEGWTYDVEVG